MQIRIRNPASKEIIILQFVCVKYQGFLGEQQQMKKQEMSSYVNMLAFATDNRLVKRQTSLPPPPLPSAQLNKTTNM